MGNQERYLRLGDMWCESQWGGRESVGILTHWWLSYGIRTHCCWCMGLAPIVVSAWHYDPLLLVNGILTHCFGVVWFSVPPTSGVWGCVCVCQDMWCVDGFIHLWHTVFSKCGGGVSWVVWGANTLLWYISSLSVRETNNQIKVLKSKPSSPKRQKRGVPWASLAPPVSVDIYFWSYLRWKQSSLYIA